MVRKTIPVDKDRTGAQNIENKFSVCCTVTTDE